MDNHACGTLPTTAPTTGRTPNIPSDASGPRLMTREEAAGYLKVSRQTLDRLRCQRGLAFYRIGGSVRFGAWDLDEFLTGKHVLPEAVLGDTNRILTKADLARFLAVSERTVEHLTAKHHLWHRKIGRCVRFRMHDVVDQLTQSFRVPSRPRPHG
jgi:excisionase family DNA binding protein